MGFVLKKFNRRNSVVRLEVERNAPGLQCVIRHLADVLFVRRMHQPSAG